MKFFLSAFVIASSLVLPACSGNKPAEEALPVEKPAAKDSTRRLAKNYFTDCHNLYAAARRSDSILLGQTAIDVKSANQAIKDFIDFAYYCQNDSMSPVYLVKTAQVARSVDNIPQAKVALDKCIADYPSFKNRPAAIFLLAQLYDEPGYLNDEQEARRLYQQIIDEYPKSDWAVSAKGAIGFIGLSDRQIMEQLKKKKKK